jgi:hypothetical protein
MLDRVAAGGRSPEQRVQDQEFREAAGRAVAQLPHDLREVFTLCFWNEFSYQQIGEVQRIEPGLARWRYFAARRRLHGALATWDPERENNAEDHHAKDQYDRAIVNMNVQEAKGVPRRPKKDPGLLDPSERDITRAFNGRMVWMRHLWDGKINEVQG